MPIATKRLICVIMEPYITLGSTTIPKLMLAIVITHQHLKQNVCL